MTKGWGTSQDNSIFSYEDWFTVVSDENANLGDINFIVNIISEDEEYPYQISVPIEIRLSLNQNILTTLYLATSFSLSSNCFHIYSRLNKIYYLRSCQ